MTATMKELLAALDDCEEKDEWRFVDVPVKSVAKVTDKAVLLVFDRYAFSKTAAGDAEVWFPLSMMRKDDADNVFFDKKMAEQKGLNV